MNFKISLGLFDGVFALPAAIVDEHLKIATGSHLKVLMYCIRHSGKQLTEGEISRATGVSSDEVQSAFLFWEQRIGVEGNSTASELQVVAPVEHFQRVKQNHVDDKSSASSVTFESAPVEQHTEKMLEKSLEEIKEVAVATVTLNRENSFSPREIAELIESDPNIAYLYSRAEILYGRPLKHTEQKTFAVILAEVGVKPEVVLILLEYCASIDKLTPHYIKAACKDWFINRGIDDFEKADQHIRKLKELQMAEAEFVRRTKIKDLPDNKKPLLNKWLFEFGFSLDVVYDAYQICLERTGQLEYKYLDKILANWNKHGIGAPPPESSAGGRGQKFAVDITQNNAGANAHKSYKNKTLDTAAPASFDLNTLEQKLIERQKRRMLNN
ncbi:MAG: DnaD domain protein [Oscillospiraceae bacterium]|nr:DnaD domain protein [Oscillospiraceae bacterium]